MKGKAFGFSFATVAAGVFLAGCGGSGAGTTLSTEAIYSVDNDNGIVRQVFPFNAVVNLFTSLTVSHVRVSPDGTKILFTSAGTVKVADIDGSNQVTLTGYKLADWNGDGSKIYAVSFTNSIRSMDPDGTNVSAEIYDGNLGGGILSFDVSRSGTKIAFSGAFLGWSRIHTINVDGSGDATLTPDNENAINVRWNEEGDLLVYERNGDIWTISESGSGAVNLTSSAEAESQPVFRRNGSIVFVKDGDLWSMSVNGSDQAELYDGTNAQSWPEVY